MRGIKAYDGEIANIGSIIVRQKGTKIFPGKNVKMGRDFTLYAVADGKVKFGHFSNSKKIVSVIPA
jgi:large subunit ribosomal protein L27